MIQRFVDYIHLMRLHKPIGIWLLFFPASWAVGLAATHDVGYFQLLMLLGAFVTRSAGCIINDITDRALDAQVARTRTRPLASGRVSVREAYVALAVLLGLALGIALSLPSAVLVLALLALPMIVAYPWMKRLTWWPQLFLGITFNLSALFGWMATGTPLAPAAFALYAAGVFWTLGYDTIYAVQDVLDDERVGIKSSALRLGRFLIPFVALCYLLMVLCLMLVGQLANAGAFFYRGVGGVALHAIWQIRHVSFNPVMAATLFRSNQWLGLGLLIAILADRLIRIV
jgi:4-hydroxybenzoate polyprenyltransferase